MVEILRSLGQIGTARILIVIVRGPRTPGPALPGSVPCQPSAGRACPFGARTTWGPKRPLQRRASRLRSWKTPRAAGAESAAQARTRAAETVGLWKKATDLPVTLDNYVTGEGYHKVWLTADGPKTRAFIRFSTEGEPMTVPIVE